VNNVKDNAESNAEGDARSDAREPCRKPYMPDTLRVVHPAAQARYTVQVTQESYAKRRTRQDIQREKAGQRKQSICNTSRQYRRATLQDVHARISEEYCAVERRPNAYTTRSERITNGSLSIGSFLCLRSEHCVERDRAMVGSVGHESL
jgi:hypothetical protein